jgi:hypothetical protein
MSLVDQRHIDGLPPPLRAILDAEIARGNHVSETWEGWPENGTAVMLARSFGADYPLQDGLRYVDVNDRHYWRAEYDLDHEGRILILACGFDP